MKSWLCDSLCVVYGIQLCYPGLFGNYFVFLNFMRLGLLQIQFAILNSLFWSYGLINNCSVVLNFKEYKQNYFKNTLYWWVCKISEPLLLYFFIAANGAWKIQRKNSNKESYYSGIRVSS